MPLNQKEMDDILEFQKRWKAQEGQRQKEREERKQRDLKEFETKIAKFNAPEPVIPSNIQPVIPSFDQFMNEVYELPDVDVGFRNAINEWESAWGHKGEADANDYNHYKEKMLYKDAKEEQDFRYKCVMPKENGKLRVNDECYKKAFQIYRNYAKPFFQETVDTISQNLEKKVPLYRYLDIPKAKELTELLVKQSKTNQSSNITTGTYWSWDLDKHRNIVGMRDSIIYDTIDDSKMSREERAKAIDDERNKWNFFFFRGYISNPKNVNFHDSVSSNMGGLDHAEVRVNENTEILVDKICYNNDYKEAWQNIRKNENAEQCITFKKPIKLSTGTKSTTFKEQKERLIKLEKKLEF